MRKIVFFCCFVVVLFSCKKGNDTTVPERRNITQAVYASGKVYPLNDYKVYSKLPGYVEKINVRVGDTVSIGQPLITIKSEISELNVNTAKNLFELAQKNASGNSPLLTSLKQEASSAKSKFELDSLNFSRYENLYKKDATSKLQYDQAKVQYDVSKQAYLRVFNNYLTNRDRINTELENARIQYDAQVSNRNDYMIASVVSGKVYDIIPKEGELVNTQQPVMEVGDDERFEVELSVDETDIGYIKIGQEVLITIDAYKEGVYKGVILETYPRISQGNKTSKVIASIIVNKDQPLYSGMSVEANIIVSEKKDALVIPREFLVDNNKVKLKSGELVEVKKGIEDLEFVEILQGVDETTEIIKP